MVSDEATIQGIEAGKQEVSAGNICDLGFATGMTPAREACQVIQTNVRLNYVAIVLRAAPAHGAAVLQAPAKEDGGFRDVLPARKRLGLWIGSCRSPSSARNGSYR